MAIKVRCRHCRKKISIDEAFAGGVCRCPYCGALNMAGGSAAIGGSVERPDRPDAPGAAAGEVPAEAEERVPLARPVRIQGIVAIVLIALLLLMGGAAGTVAYLYWRSVQPPPVEPSPFAKKGARVIDAEFSPPVVYVLDASSAAWDVLDLGVVVVRHSILSLDEDDKFQLLLVQEGGVRKPTGDWAGGGKAGDARVKAFLADKTGMGATDLAGAVEQAIDLSPKTVVLLAGKEPAPDGDAVAALGERAARAGVVLHCVSLGDYSYVTEPMEALCRKTGGRCQAYSVGALGELLDKAPPLP